MAGFAAALRFLPFAVSGLAVLALWWLWADRQGHLDQIATLEREKAVQQAVLEQEREAKAVLNAHLQRMEVQHAQTSETLSELRDLPGRDVPLSDLLSATVERLR